MTPNEPYQMSAKELVDISLGGYGLEPTEFDTTPYSPTVGYSGNITRGEDGKVLFHPTTAITEADRVFTERAVKTLLSTDQEALADALDKARDEDLRKWVEEDDKRIVEELKRLAAMRTLPNQVTSQETE